MNGETLRTPANVAKVIREKPIKYCDPRSFGKRAETYLEPANIEIACPFSPENEFYIFGSVRWSNELNGCSYHIDSVQGAWNSGTVYDGGHAPCDRILGPVEVRLCGAGAARGVGAVISR